MQWDIHGQEAYKYQGRIQDFKLRGGVHLKKLCRAEGGAKIFGVFRVKNHDFTPKNLIFSKYRRGARRVRHPWICPWIYILPFCSANSFVSKCKHIWLTTYLFCLLSIFNSQFLYLYEIHFMQGLLKKN